VFDVNKSSGKIVKVSIYSDDEKKLEKLEEAGYEKKDILLHGINDLLESPGYATHERFKLPGTLTEIQIEIDEETRKKLDELYERGMDDVDIFYHGYRDLYLFKRVTKNKEESATSNN